MRRWSWSSMSSAGFRPSASAVAVRIRIARDFLGRSALRHEAPWRRLARVGGEHQRDVGESESEVRREMRGRMNGESRRDASELGASDSNRRGCPFPVFATPIDGAVPFSYVKSYVFT
jgi:hypothetical protein